MSRIEYTTVSRREPSGSTWWLRSTPSSLAPSRSIAARLVKLKKCVRNSTATQLNSSKAWPSISSFASLLTPLRDGFCLRRGSEPQFAKLVIGGDVGDLRNVFAGKRFQSHPALSGQRDRLNKTAHESRLTADHAASIAHTDTSTANTAADAPM